MRQSAISAQRSVAPQLFKSEKLRKIGPDLAALVARPGPPQPRGGVGVPRGASDLQAYPLQTIVDGKVLIDAVASGDAADLLAELQALGLERGAKAGRMVSGWLPVSAVEQLEGCTHLQFAQASASTASVGLTTSQGDAAIEADAVKALLGIDGSGVTIGTLSDSFDCLGGAAGDVTSGDLPSGIVVLDDTACPASDEGRAMMQLIHDVAPGSAQAFHTAFNGQADFALGILELAGLAGADVIVDDVIYFAEPMFQDGIIAQAVDTVKASGSAYFSSAGNNARDAWDDSFRSSGIPGVFGGIRHDFDPGPGVDDLQTFILGTGLSIFVFQWDEPSFSVSGAPGSASDMDIVLYLPGGIFIGIGGFAFNIGVNPVEVFGVINLGPPTPVEFGLELFAGPAPGFMKYVFFGPSANTVVEFPTASGSLYGHANANGAEAVGAARYTQTPAFGQSPPLLEPFSSAGPTPIFFDTAGSPIFELRSKPEIVAPDGTNTTFFGFDFEPDGFPNFFGTSAAAPHAAAAAALIKETNASLGPDAVYGLLESTAIDMNGPGFDFDTGFGLINARDAVEEAARSGRKFQVCHIPKGQPSNQHTIVIAGSAVPAHVAHGDKFGPCN